MLGDNDETEPTGHGYPYATFDVAVYNDSNGTDEASSSNDGSTSDGVNRNTDYENGDSSWTYDRYSGSNSSASVSSSMLSSDSDSGSGSADDDGDSGSGDGSAVDDDVQDTDANKGKKKKNGAKTDRNDGYKWIKALCTIMVQNSGVGKQERDKRSRKPVKTILRPPTKYQYVIGMSGFPSKVPVYPKWT